MFCFGGGLIFSSFKHRAKNGRPLPPCLIFFRRDFLQARPHELLFDPAERERETRFHSTLAAAARRAVVRHAFTLCAAFGAGMSPPAWFLAVAPAPDHAWPGQGSPENPARVQAALQGVASARVPPPTRLNAWPTVSRATLATVHELSHLDWLDGTASLASPTKVADVEDEAEFTYASGGTRDAAVDAAAAAVDLTHRVLAPSGPRFALSLCRPPGHHAGSGAGGPGDDPSCAPSGFCFINSVAVAAKAARAASIDRVAIVDIDVHVGDGTASIFDADPSVLVIDCHEHGVWPGGGGVSHTGAARATINAPLPQGSGDAAAVAVAARVIGPALARFRPGIVLVSLGCDAHAGDPLGKLEFTRAAYRALGASVAGVGVPVAAVLEGGYSEAGLVDGVGGFVEGVLGGAVAACRLPSLTRDEEAAIAAVEAEHGLAR